MFANLINALLEKVYHQSSEKDTSMYVHPGAWFVMQSLIKHKDKSHVNCIHYDILTAELWFSYRDTNWIYMENFVTW